MNALLLVAHGSRLAGSNNEVAELAGRMSDFNDGRFDFVQHAFLELAKPDIETAIDVLVEQGVTEITVSPYFLSAGRHVVSDVPEIVQRAQARHGHVRFTQLPHLGATPGMAQLLLENAVT